MVKRTNEVVLLICVIIVVKDEGEKQGCASEILQFRGCEVWRPIGPYLNHSAFHDHVILSIRHLTSDRSNPNWVCRYAAKPVPVSCVNLGICTVNNDT